MIENIVYAAQIEDIFALHQTKINTKKHEHRERKFYFCFRSKPPFVFL